jgi:hypothetical protein
MLEQATVEPVGVVQVADDSCDHLSRRRPSGRRTNAIRRCGQVVNPDLLSEREGGLHEHFLPVFVGVRAKRIDASPVPSSTGSVHSAALTPPGRSGSTTTGATSTAT